MKELNPQLSEAGSRTIPIIFLGTILHAGSDGYKVRSYNLTSWPVISLHPSCSR